MKNKELLEKTFIYERSSVKLTGRMASKKGIRGNEKIMVEIVDKEIMDDIGDVSQIDEMNLRWVSLSELYVIFDIDPEDNKLINEIKKEKF